MRVHHILLLIVVLLIIGYIAARKAGVNLPTPESAFTMFSPTK